MEVADQWRREWAGTAEYGKVTEGGVTRRVARAMEVLHASGPGARVRVMRAAYHSSAGPGAPAESFMLHSSRRVISSGFNFLESPTVPTKPLEISSTPLELTHDSNGETENYKVTEPDDLDISEPSKWRGSTRGNSIRMPSEESSSTDNASIIDLDPRSSRNLHRKYSYDSENSDIQFRSRSSSRTSQLLDAPTTLSTLKFKSLLNNSNEWNSRRKSYSFEDTSPLNESILHSNNTLAMESSTDSGICKSTEIMNDHIDDSSHTKYFSKEERKTHKEESFKDWLSKNRQNSHYSGTKFKTYREHEIVLEDPKENNIALQSSGKVCITLPITIEADNDDNEKKVTDEVERRVKKVEFCKTEVHFAAESGKVNIIATDEKPPPSNDFRKRRSAFVPMQDIIDRPITLFGEKNDFREPNGLVTSLNHNNGDFGETDENTAATKSILKNKIPKPKPYLLGENMEFGKSDNDLCNSTNSSVLTAVSLVNQQIESERKQYKSDLMSHSIFTREAEKNVIDNKVYRTMNGGPTNTDTLNNENNRGIQMKIQKDKKEFIDEVKNNFSSLHVSSAEVKPKTRKLRDSDLTYFGIDSDHSDRKLPLNRILKPTENKSKRENIDTNVFNSVKLIKQISNSVSNSVCNSEPESEESPEYQNVPMNINFAPVPTPRLRSKYDKPTDISEVKAGLRSIVERERDGDVNHKSSYTRRTKVRRQEEVKTSRSLSAPPKNLKWNSQENSYKREDPMLSSNKYKFSDVNSKKAIEQISTIDTKGTEEEIPIYANLNVFTEKPSCDELISNDSVVPMQQREMHKSSATRNKGENHYNKLKDHRPESGAESGSLRRNNSSVNKETLSSSLKREATSKRSEKANKSHLYNNDTKRKLNDEPSPTRQAHKNRESRNKIEQTNKTEKKQHGNGSLTKRSTDETGLGSLTYNTKHRDTSKHRRTNSSQDKTSVQNVKSSQNPDSTPHRISTQTKSDDKEKELGSKSSSHRANKHREYVINYDDKNGTFSSISKIKPSLGTPRRKKTVHTGIKDMIILKENSKHTSPKSKTVDKIAVRK